jgi:outer membrane lipase/esterase
MKKILFPLLAFTPAAWGALSGAYIAQDGTQFPVADVTSALSHTEAVSAFSDYQADKGFTDFAYRITDAVEGAVFEWNTATDTMTCSSPRGSSSLPFESPSDAAIIEFQNNCFPVLSGGHATEEQQAINAVNAATTINLQLNRSTTQMSRSLQSMRTLRQNPNSSNAGGGAGDGYELVGPFGLYVNSGGTFGNVESNSTAAGFDLYTRNFNGGVDLKISDRLFTGLLFGYTSSSAEVVNSGGRLDADTFRFSPFVTLLPTENTYIDIAAGYASHDNRSKRNCAACATSANAAFRTDEYNIHTGLGYTHSFGAWSLRGYGEASAIYMDISGYQESGDASIGLLNVPNQYVTSVTSTFGTELSYAWSLPFGVITPRVTGEWVREYANDARVTQALIQGGGSTLITSNSPETDWGNIGAGVLVTLPNGLSAMFNYQSLIMSDAVNHTIEGGVRFEF